MKFKHKETGAIFETNDKNLFSMLEREGYEKVVETPKKKKEE